MGGLAATIWRCALPQGWFRTPAGVRHSEAPVAEVELFADSARTTLDGPNRSFHGAPARSRRPPVKSAALLPPLQQAWPPSRRSFEAGWLRDRLPCGFPTAFVLRPQ